MSVCILFPNSSVWLSLLQSAIATGRKVQKSGIISKAPFILWTAQLTYPRKSGRMNKTPVLVPRFQSYGRGQFLYHFSAGQIVVRVWKAPGLWKRAQLRQQGSRKTSIVGGQSVHWEYLEGQTGDRSME